LTNKQSTLAYRGTVCVYVADLASSRPLDRVLPRNRRLRTKECDKWKTVPICTLESTLGLRNSVRNGAKAARRAGIL
jgi:hypothetical protein